MTTDPITATHEPQWYIRLVTLAQSEDDAPLWSADELQEIWQHQLNANLTRCMEEFNLVLALECQSLCNASTPPIHTMRDLLAHQDPPQRLMILLARWLESELGDTDEFLPRDISRALLNVVLALTRSRCGIHIIDGADNQMARRAAAVAQRPWLDDETRKLMTDVAAHLGGVDSERA